MTAFKTSANISRFLKTKFNKQSMNWILSLKVCPKLSKGSGLSPGTLKELHNAGVTRPVERNNRYTTWGPGKEYDQFYEMVCKDYYLVERDVKEDDIITIFEITRVALDIGMDRLRDEMGLDKVCLTKIQKIVTDRLNPIYGSRLKVEEKEQDDKGAYGFGLCKSACKGSRVPVYKSGDEEGHPSEWTCIRCGASGLMK